MNEKILYAILDPQILDSRPDEWGVVVHCVDPRSMGFATTLTPAVIEQAVARKIELLVTHHDAWKFMLDVRQTCMELLAQHRISHVWCHTPLDTVDFGTAASLLMMTGCRIIGTIAKGEGRIGESLKPLHLSHVIKMLNRQLSEKPCRIYDADRLVARIACVTGAGTRIDHLAEALGYGVDLYVTGETSLYLLEYASFHRVSVLIYSHNYTEIFGTQNLAHKIADQLQINKVVRLNEPHY
ncbi:MAG TPA: Nif3-like dinuclear metal center hexameric protein [Anaerolineales bacterium]|nr:Nif3-like dinuclear metal center hexameric protein [Anaerolineales bacterium]